MSIDAFHDDDMRDRGLRHHIAIRTGQRIHTARRRDRSADARVEQPIIMCPATKARAGDPASDCWSIVEWCRPVIESPTATTRPLPGSHHLYRERKTTTNGKRPLCGKWSSPLPAGSGLRT